MKAAKDRNKARATSDHHDGHPAPKRKREYKRKNKNNNVDAMAPGAPRLDKDRLAMSSDDEGVGGGAKSDSEEEDPDGAYAFRRKAGCSYHAPRIETIGGWPWDAPDDGGAGDKRFRYCLTSVSQPRARPLGYCRRRVGRGGRIVFDRCTPPTWPTAAELDMDIDTDVVVDMDIAASNIPHFKPRATPAHANSLNGQPLSMSMTMSIADNEHDYDVPASSMYDDDGNLIPVVDISAESVDNGVAMARTNSSSNNGSPRRHDTIYVSG